VIDPAQRHRNVVVHYESNNSRIALMVNGQLLSHSEQSRAHSFSYHVTPLVKFGEPNLIELVNPSGSASQSFPSIEIRYYDRGVYP